MWILKAFALISLVVVLVEDLRHRAVHWSAFAALALYFGVHGWLTVRRAVFISDTLFNVGFLLTQFLLATVWFSLRHGKPINLLRAHIGPGDMLFMSLTAMVFSRVNFIFFVLTGMLFSLLVHGIIRLAFRRTPTTVPTAGLLALYLAGWFVLELSGLVGPLHSSIPLIPLQ